MRHLNTIQFVEYDYESVQEMDTHHEEMKTNGWQRHRHSNEELTAAFMLLEVLVKKKIK